MVTKDNKDNKDNKVDKDNKDDKIVDNNINKIILLVTYVSNVIDYLS